MLSAKVVQKRRLEPRIPKLTYTLTIDICGTRKTYEKYRKPQFFKYVTQLMLYTSVPNWRTAVRIRQFGFQYELIAVNILWTADSDRFYNMELDNNPLGIYAV